MKKAKFEHDCKECKYLGESRDKSADLYYCKRSDTPVARFSSEGSDYSSGLAFVGIINVLTEAYDLAMKENLVPLSKQRK